MSFFSENPWIIGVIVVVLLVLYIISIFNNLTKYRVRVKDAASQIVIQLKNRADLIPNLQSVAKGLSDFEKEIQIGVAQSRSAVNALPSDPRKLDPNEVQKVDKAFSSSLGRLLATAEAYPQIKSDQSFLKFQDSLEATENKIAAARRFFNGGVREYNEKLLVFPHNIVGSIFGFKEWDFYDDSNAEEMAKGLGTTDFKVSF